MAQKYDISQAMKIEISFSFLLFWNMKETFFSLQMFSFYLPLFNVWKIVVQNIN